MHCMLCCAADQHSILNRMSHIIPANSLTSANMHHGNYVCNIHAIYVHIQLPMHAYSCICIILYRADAEQTARNSASGWNRTSSSCLCSCAPLHHTSFPQCHAMLQSMQQAKHAQYNQNNMQCSHATLLQVLHSTMQTLLVTSQPARYLTLELG